MSDEVKGVTATAPESVANESKPMDLEGFVSMQMEKAANAKPIIKTSSESSVPSDEEDVPEQDTAESEEDVPSNTQNQDPKTNEDWDKLSDDELLETVESNKPKARYPNRLAELVRQRKAAEKAAAEAKAFAQQAAKKPDDALRYENDEPNPYSDVKDVQQLATKAKEVDRLIEFAEDVLDEHEHAAFDDVVYREGDKDYTKAEIKRTLKMAKKARQQHLPAQAQAIQVEQQRQALGQQLMAEVKSKYQWMGEEQNDVRAQFETMSKHPIFQKIIEKVPDAAPLLNPLLAHAANSMYNVREPVVDKAKPKPEPPSASPRVAANEAPENRSQRTVKDIEAKGKSEGLTMDDFVALQVAKSKATKR